MTDKYFSDRRFGRFAINEEDLDDIVLISKIMQLIFVVRCEHDYASQRFVYTAWCQLFDEIEEGQAPEWYDFYLNDDYKLCVKKETDETTGNKIQFRQYT